jgi:hypothetical protein
LTAALVAAMALVAPAAQGTAQAATRGKITSVSPKSGSTKGGTTVTVKGTGFTKVKKITVGGARATKVKVLSSRKLRFRTPAHAAGTVTIVITTAGGKIIKKRAFRYRAPVVKPTPLIDSGPITLSSGQTITGRHITSTTGPCVTVASGAVDVRIVGNEIGPCGKGVDDVGVLIKSKASRITISKNTIHNVSSGALADRALNPIEFSYNTVYDVRGPFPRGQMVQFAGVSGAAGQSKIIGNVSDKQRATIKTTYEDHINLYQSSGSAAHPILIACNKLRGSATANDLTTGQTTSNGSGIMVGDNGGGWVDVRSNVIVYTPNTGVGVAGGSHVNVSGNLIYNRGKTAGSMTQEAVTVFPFAGFTPTAVTITSNRGAANAWKYGSTGQFVNGYWADPAVTGVTLAGNNFTDTTLTEAIWNTTLVCAS